jgi:hypothetical protein
LEVETTVLGTIGWSSVWEFLRPESQITYVAIFDI